MKVALVLLFVTAALAAPQDINTEDAEFVPRGTGSGDTQDGGGFVVVMPRFNFNPFTNFFRRVFSSDPSVSEDGVPGTFDTPDSDQPRRPGGFFSFIDSVFRRFPSPLDNSTETFRNSSIEVINIGGVPMQVNRTIVEHTNDDGSVYRRIDQRLIGPLANHTTTPFPGAEDEINELESELSTVHAHSIQKRWIRTWLKNFLKKRKSASGPSHNHLPDAEHHGKEEEEERTLVDDIDVNFLGNLPPHNPDAEVFDPELMRESERRFKERHGNSEVSQPLRSHQPMSQPLRSQPMMSRPLRSQPMMSQPLRSPPMMSQPLRSQPMMSQPLRSQPMMSQPMRSQPMMSQPLITRHARL